MSDNKSKTKPLKNCHDCGRFVEKKRWVPAEKRNERHPLCRECACLYDSPWDV